jgi:pyrimidine operon attenuation protein/uracil phosphoribosyltransferase
MNVRLLSSPEQLELTLQRLCHQVIENNIDLSNLAIIGLQPRGVCFSNELVSRLKQLKPKSKFDYGKLDISFYRDDFKQNKNIVPDATDLNFSIENKQVILIDDVFYTGRTIRAALDALMDYGRPAAVQLLVLIHRKYHQHVPIKPDFIGIEIDTIGSQKVKVEWTTQNGEPNQIWILDEPTQKP